MESLPESLIGEIRKLCRDVVLWTKNALKKFPDNFVKMKMACKILLTHRSALEEQPPFECPRGLNGLGELCV